MADGSEKARIVEVDLSGFAPEKPPIWRGVYAPVLFIFGSMAIFFLPMLLLGRSGVYVGLALMAIWIVGIVVAAGASLWTNVKGRAVASTTGVKLEALRPADAGRVLLGYDRTLGEILTELKRYGPAEAAATAALRTDPEARRHANLYRWAAAGVAVFAILIAVFPPHIMGALPAVLEISLAIWLLTRARRALAAPAEQVTANDPRPPVLFLRSFQDDKVRVGQWQQLLNGALRVRQLLRFEEALGQVVRAYGPFLAIGEPNEGLPQLGAARAYPGEEGWQSWVLERIRTAQFITMLCGPTRWVHWEVQNIVSAERLHRFLLYLPPGRGVRAEAQRKRLERWDNIVRSLEATPYGPALARLDIAEALLIRFERDGTLKVFRSRTDSEQDYELATALAVHDLFSETGEEGSPLPPAEPPLAGTPAPPVKPEPEPPVSGEAPRPRPAVERAPEASLTDAEPIYDPARGALWAVFAVAGLASGLLHILATIAFASAPNANWLFIPLTPALITLAARLYYSRDSQFLARLFLVLLGADLAAVIAALVVNLVVMGLHLPFALRIPFLTVSFPVVWPLITYWALTAVFPQFRGERLRAEGLRWVGATDLVILLLVFTRSPVLVAIATLALSTIVAGLIGAGLSRRRPEP